MVMLTGIGTGEALGWVLAPRDSPSEGPET